MEIIKGICKVYQSRLYIDKTGVEKIRTMLLEEKSRGKTYITGENIQILCDEVHEMKNGVLH